MPTLDPATRERMPMLALVVGALMAGLALCASLRHPGRPDGTARMAERLRGITAATDPMENPFMNAARARRMERSIEARGEASPKALSELAAEMLNAGRTREAITLLDRLEGLMRPHGVDPRSRLWTSLRTQQAVAHLRLAEESNCTLHHNARSCLFPIRGSGVHTQPEGSRAAAGILLDVLEHEPGDLSARWLLNVAFMTLGEYPEQVPARWLLPPSLFESEADLGRFPDVAGETGLDVEDLAGGSIADDFDGDGYLDLMVSAMGLASPLRYFHNDADGTFNERTEDAGLTGLHGGLNIIQTDYDNDSLPDVLVLRGGWMGSAGRYPKSLLHNDGAGRFTDVTEEAGLLTFHPSQTAVWSDFDGDGWLDLFVGNESTEGDVHPCELLRNNGDGTFSECAREAGVAAVGFVKGVASGDYDNDGRADLYVSVRGGPNLLYHNDGPPREIGRSAVEIVRFPRRSGCRFRFTEVAEAAGVSEPFFSFPSWFFDYDNDGWEDLFVSGYMMGSVGDVAADSLGLPHEGERPRLYRNRGDGTFSDETRAARLDRLLLTMGSNYGDLDNDGWLDFYAGTGNPGLGTLIPNRMFRNAGGRLFQDVTTSGGFGHLQKGHGVSFADLDNDGDQDVYMVVGGAFEADRFRNALFENPGHGNHWIALHLEGVRSNRPGIGARIRIVVEGPDGERVIHKTVRSGGSFGASPLRQEIGLGSATHIQSVEILWPSGESRQSLGGLPMDQHYRVREGDSEARPIPLRRLVLGGGPANTRQ
jgi:hypothetical protein